MLRKFYLNKSNSSRILVFIFVAFVMVIPRIPIFPLGYGELSIRVDGLISIIAGFLILYVFKVRLLIIPLVFIAVLYFGDFKNFFISTGLFFQVVSIFALPALFNLLRFSGRLICDLVSRYFELVIVLSALVSVLIAVISRFFLFEFCVDSITSTGCFGSYGMLDRPYIFSVFIGSAFVLLCGSGRLMHVNVIILMYGLYISDSRSISVIMYALGMVNFMARKNVTVKKYFFVGIISSALLIAAFFGAGKMSISSVPVNEPDPSWMMRVDSINKYMDWVDVQKLFFGDGALAFYQFAEPYGQPGPIDNLYFRLASEVGLVGVFVLLCVYIYPLIRIAKNNGNVILLISYLLSVAAISVFQESLIAPRSGHVLVMLGVVLAYKNRSAMQK